MKTQKESQSCLFQFRGDSFFIVGSDGKRVYNEKSGSYDKRSRMHFQYPENNVLFAICDHANYEAFASDVAMSFPLDLNKYAAIADDLNELAKKIKAKYPKLYFNENFESNLLNEYETYNKFAFTGRDDDFGRGKAYSDSQWVSKIKQT